MIADLIGSAARKLGASEDAQIGVYRAWDGSGLSQLERRVLGEYERLFWAVGIEEHEGMRFKLAWLGFWTSVQDIHEAERGWRALWWLSIIWNID